MLKSENGASAVEFALIAPLLFVLTFAIVEFGILLFDKAVITNAAREGARAAIVFNRGITEPYLALTASEVETVVRNYTDNYLINLGSPSGTISPPAIQYIEVTDSNGDLRTDIEVQVNYTYDFLIFPNLSNLIGGGFTGDIDLEGTTRMRMELASTGGV